MRWKRLLAISSATALLVVGIESQVTAGGGNLNGLKPCFPDWDGYFARDRAELVAQTQQGGERYFLFHIYQPQVEDPEPLIVSKPVGNGECTREHLNVTGHRSSWSKALGNRTVGRQLKLGLYKADLERMGQQGLQQHVNEAARASDRAWLAEDVWALRQLGISVPKSVEVRR